MAHQQQSTVREHSQKIFVALSGFWLLRGWGGLSDEPVKKEKLWQFKF